METTLAQRAYRELRGMLRRGELPPGTRLVNRALAEQIGVSLTPVREAINQLASEGLVDYVRGAGAYVRDPDLLELAQLYDLRENLEPYAAEQAARLIAPAELAELEHLCGQTEALLKDVPVDPAKLEEPVLDRWLELEQAFHGTLLRAARNPWLLKVAEELRFLSQVFQAHRRRPCLLDRATAEETLRDHRAQLDAVQRGDADRARELARTAIQLGRRHVLGEST